MKTLTILLLALPCLVVAKKCSNPTSGPAESTTDSTTWSTMTTPTTTEETTTPLPPPPTNWPRGRFTLIKAGSKCPKGGHTWRSAVRYQDSEDYRNQNSFPTDSPGLTQPMKSDGIQMAFCSKVNNKGDKLKLSWPAGDYCIAKKSSCPSGFMEGHLKWDDENTFNMNSMKGNGKPTGVFNKDTKIDFCCRNDSSASTPILLPVDVPFYLWQHGNECQTVGHMDYIEEIIQYDDEDTDNQNEAVGAHPRVDLPNDFRIHLCYYTATGVTSG